MKDSSLYFTPDLPFVTSYKTILYEGFILSAICKFKPESSNQSAKQITRVAQYLVAEIPVRYGVHTLRAARWTNADRWWPRLHVFGRLICIIVGHFTDEFRRWYSTGCSWGRRGRQRKQTSPSNIGVTLFHTGMKTHGRIAAAPRRVTMFCNSCTEGECARYRCTVQQPLKFYSQRCNGGRMRVASGKNNRSKLSGKRVIRGSSGPISSYGSRTFARIVWVWKYLLQQKRERSKGRGERERDQKIVLDGRAIL